ncbi:MULTISPECIES: hypothetical protein [unclassified Streptomyces]|uniref:hypothetical protein n=1 Tax=unclassified Streptomyces TaxID=2593676 RepID=UPI003689F454
MTAAVVFGAQPASAVSFKVYTQDYGKYVHGAGTENFRAYGDYIDLCDDDSDGAGVVGYWYVNSGSVHSWYNGDGAGICLTQNHDFAETSEVHMRVCLRDNGVELSNTCSDWVDFSAGGN